MRGPAATIEEWLMSAEYILAAATRKLFYANAAFEHLKLLRATLWT